MLLKNINLVNNNIKKKLPRVRIELTTSRLLRFLSDYETDALTNCATEAYIYQDKIKHKIKNMILN